MVSKMTSKSRLFVDILGPSPKEPSREAKWSPRGAKRLRKLIQKEVHRGSKWNINACILETVRSIFFLLTRARRKRMWALASKTGGFSPHRGIDFRQISVIGIVAKDWQHCVSSGSCGGSKRKSLTMGALAPI